MSTDTRRLAAELDEAAERLKIEFDDLSPGSVLRCLSRAVYASRRAHVPPAQLAGVSETLARQMLRLRRGTGLPRQRFPSE
ncbi:MAG: hypothetical protein ABWX84_12335 [Nocardioides sp.]